MTDVVQEELKSQINDILIHKQALSIQEIGFLDRMIVKCDANMDILPHEYTQICLLLKRFAKF